MFYMTFETETKKKYPAMVSSCGFHFVFTFTEAVHLKLYIIDVSHESRDKGT